MANSFMLGAIAGGGGIAVVVAVLFATGSFGHNAMQPSGPNVSIQNSSYPGQVTSQVAQNSTNKGIVYTQNKTMAVPAGQPVDVAKYDETWIKDMVNYAVNEESKLSPWDKGNGVDLGIGTEYDCAVRYFPGPNPPMVDPAGTSRFLVFITHYDRKVYVDRIMEKEWLKGNFKEIHSDANGFGIPTLYDYNYKYSCIESFNYQGSFPLNFIHTDSKDASNLESNVIGIGVLSNHKEAVDEYFKQFPINPEFDQPVSILPENFTQ